MPKGLDVSEPSVVSQLPAPGRRGCCDRNSFTGMSPPNKGELIMLPHEHGTAFPPSEGPHLPPPPLHVLSLQSPCAPIPSHPMDVGCQAVSCANPFPNKPLLASCLHCKADVAYPQYPFTFITFILSAQEHRLHTAGQEEITKMELSVYLLLCKIRRYWGL